MNSLIIQRDFDPEVAREIDTDAAIILQNIVHWVGYNAAQDKPHHFHQNKWWTYSSIEALIILFPYLTYKQIRTRIDKLEETGYIIKGNFNKVKYDKTTWFSLGEKYNKVYKSLCPNGQIEVTKQADGDDQKVTPIPNDNTDYKLNKEILVNNPLQERKENRAKAASRKGRRLGMASALINKPYYEKPQTMYVKKGGTHAEDIV